MVDILSEFISTASYRIREQLRRNCSPCFRPTVGLFLRRLRQRARFSSYL